MITRVTAASHASRRADSGVIVPASSSEARPPARASSAARSIVTTTCGRSPPMAGRSARSSHSRQISPNASARRCAGIRPILGPFAGPGIDLCPERRDQVLPVLRIKLAVGSNHAVDPDDRREPSAGVAFVLVSRRPSGVGEMPPAVERHPKVPMRERFGRLEQRLLSVGERFRRRLARPDHRLHRGSRDLALRERIRDPRHLFQRPSHAHLHRGGALRDPVARRQPRRGRQLPVGRVHASAFDLGQTSGTFGLDHPGGPLELVQPDAELLVRQGRKVVEPKLVQRGPQRAHERGPLQLEHMFGAYTAGLTLRRSRTDRSRGLLLTAHRDGDRTRNEDAAHRPVQPRARCGRLRP